MWLLEFDFIEANRLITVQHVGQGWRSGESARLPPCGPGSNPGVDAICGLSLSRLVLSFAPGTPVFPSP